MRSHSNTQFGICILKPQRRAYKPESPSLDPPSSTNNLRCPNASTKIRSRAGQNTSHARRGALGIGSPTFRTLHNLHQPQLPSLRDSETIHIRV